MPEGKSDDSPPNYGGMGILAELYTFLAITLILISLRGYVALRITHIFDAADVTVLIATVFLVVSAVCLNLEVREGLGQYIKYLADPEYQAHQVLRWNTYFQIFNKCTTLFTKYSISLYILRIKNTKPTKRVLAILMSILTLATIAVIVILSVSCVPLRALWDPNTKGHCLSSDRFHVVSYVDSAFTVATDLALTVSPIVIIWNIRIRKEQKIFIVFLMSLGLVATVSNVLRNVFLSELTNPDLTHAQIPITILAILELNSGVIAACVPACVPIFTSRRVKKRSEISSSSYRMGEHLSGDGRAILSGVKNSFSAHLQMNSDITVDTASE